MRLKTDLGCTPLTKHWLQKEFGAPFVLNKQSYIGKYLLSLISKPTHLYPKTNYPTSIQVIISENIYARNGIIFTPDAERDFNNFIHDQVYDRFFSSQAFLANLNLNSKVKIKESIEAFLNAEELPEGILAYDTIKKRWYRKRNATQKIKNQPVK